MVVDAVMGGGEEVSEGMGGGGDVFCSLIHVRPTDDACFILHHIL